MDTQVLLFSTVRGETASISKKLFFRRFGLIADSRTLIAWLSKISGRTSPILRSFTESAGIQILVGSK